MLCNFIIALLFFLCSSPFQQMSMDDSFIFNFDNKKISGYKAINIHPQGEVRTPNSAWQGLGLSQTSPVPIEPCDDSTWSNSNHDARFNLTTTVLDLAPTRQRHQLSQYNDVTSILAAIGLEHHIRE